MLAYFAFLHGPEVDLSCAHLKEVFILYQWREGEVIGFANKPVLKYKEEGDVPFVYHERRLSSITFCF